MICKLCHNDKELLRKSHIVPNFMYRDLFDEKHRVHEALISDQYPVKSKVRQSGAYEQNILCRECDNNLLGELERYGSMVLYGGTPLSVKKEIQPNGMASTYAIGIDYQRFGMVK